MTQLDMSTEFDYFMVSRAAIVDKLVADGYAHNVTERVRAVVERLAESDAGFDKSDSPYGVLDHHQRYVPSGSWWAAINGYIKGLVRPGEFGGVPDHGSLQFDSFADADYGQYWVIDLHHKNVYRGEGVRVPVPRSVRRGQRDGQRHTRLHGGRPRHGGRDRSPVHRRRVLSESRLHRLPPVFGRV